MKPNLNIARSLVQLIIAVAFLTAASFGQVDTGGVVSFGTLGLGQSTSSISPVRQVAVGFAFVAALRSDGTVVCWGDNSGGQCSVPPGLTGVTQIACGRSHCVALKADGTVVCWGSNRSNQCSTPSGLNNVTQVVAAGSFTIAVKSDGTLAAWGDDSSNAVTSAQKVHGVVEGSAGVAHALFLLGDGSIGGIGDNTYYELINPGNVFNAIEVSAYGYQSAALFADGTIKAWGGGSTNIPVSLTGAVHISGPYALLPTGVVKAYLPDSSVPNPPTNLANVVQIACESQYGPMFGVALKSDGSVTCWGDNSLGQCDVPLALSTTLRTASSMEHTLYLTADRKVRCRGANLYGECNVPPGLANVIQIDANEGVISPNFLPVFSAHSMALTADGTVSCWGDNLYGQSNVPVGLKGVVQIAAGGHHSVALKSDGSLTEWGLNTSGQCDIPVGLPKIQQVAAGGGHTVALSTSGQVFCWGDNSSGQCNVPPGLAKVVHVAAGDQHTAALKSDGTVVFWGSNSYYQSSPPVDLTTIAQVAAGAQHTAVRKANGNVLSWGGYLPFDPNKVTHGQDLVPAGLVAAADLSAGFYVTNAVPVVNIGLSNWLVTAGGSTNATIFLPTAPGVGGADVKLITDNVGVTCPISVHFNPGVQTAVVPIAVSASVARSSVKVAAIYRSQIALASFRVAPSAAPASVVTPTSVYSGRLVISSVMLGRPVTVPTTIKIYSDSPNLTPVLPSILLPIGADSFTILSHTKSVSVSTVAHLIIAEGATTITTGTVTLLPPYVVAFSPGSAYGGTSASCTISVPFPVYGFVGATFNLSSSSSSLAVPPTATINQGAKSVTFPVQTKGVDAPVTATLTAGLGPVAPVSASLRIVPAQILSVAISPKPLVGDNIATVSATLNGVAGPSGTKVYLSEDNAAGNLPAYLTVPGGSPTGSTTFSPRTVSTPTTVTVTGNTGSTSAQTNFLINPTPNHLQSVQFTPNFGTGGSQVTMTATFSGPSAPTGLTLVLNSSSPLMNLPPTLTSAPGATSLSFNFSPNGSSVATPIIVQVRGGSTTLPASFSLMPTLFEDFYVFGPSYFLSNSYTCKGGDTVEGILFSNGNAPAGGLQAHLTCSDPTLVTVPSTASIAGGQFVFQFPIVTKPVASAQTVTVTAQAGSFVQKCTLTIQTAEPNPATLEGISLQPNVKGGTTAYGAAYSYGATTNGFSISLKSSDPTIASVPSTLLIGKTPNPTNISITTKPVTVAKTVTITATQGSVVKSATITVTP